jgi:hypothetical protein
MHHRAGWRRAASALAAAAIVAVLLATLAPIARAQAWNYPSFQQSHVVNRDFTFGVADGGNAGTSFLVQWREELEPMLQQVSADAGFAVHRRGGAPVGFVGATYGYQITPQTEQQPVEFLGTVGANFAFGGGTTFFRLPVGVSAGHRFPISGGIAFTPYAHPRLAFESCNDCGTNGKGRAELGLGFGLGANVELTRQLALRIDSSFGFSSVIAPDNAVAIGVTWSPIGLRRP